MKKVNENFYDVYNVTNVKKGIRQIMIEIHNQYPETDRYKVVDELEDMYGHYVDPNNGYLLALSVDSCKKLISILEEAVKRIEK